MLPGIISHLGAEGVNQLKRLAFANSLSGQRDGEDDIPDLVKNFDSQGLSDEESDVKGPVEVVD